MILLLKFIYYLNLFKKGRCRRYQKLLAFKQYDKSFQKMINTRNWAS